MRCSACDEPLGGATANEAFTGDVCPQCRGFAHPTRLGDYVELELLQRGGMGSVYRGVHRKVGTPVAVKVVRIQAEGVAERFEREARVAARIPHPGVVRVIDYDANDGRLYLVMELVDGMSLREVVREGPRDVAWCIDTTAQLADVLEAAHGQGIVHRDVKPDNVIVDRTGRVRVLDFGISRVLDEGESLTRTGELIGTPQYMAPEQILDAPEAVDARADVWATGVVLYELLTGRSPFAGDNMLAVLRQVESFEPPPPSRYRPEIPPALDDLVLATLAKHKERRPRSCGDLAQRLHALEPNSPAGVRAGRPGSTVVVVALACLALGWLLRGGLGGGDTAPDELPRPSENQATVLAAAQLEQVRDALAPRALREAAPWLGADSPLSIPTPGLAADLVEAVESPPADRAAAIEAMLPRLERTDPLRYELELAAAVVSRHLPRMRAAAELAAVSGDRDRATALYLAGRAALAIDDGALHAQTAAELLALADSLSTDAPGILRTKLAFALGARDRKRASELAREAFGDTDPPEFEDFAAFARTVRPPK